MTTSRTADAPGAAPLLDLQSLVAAVRRRRRLWSSMALLGLLVGAAVAVLLPPPPAAVTTVLVAHQEDQPNDTGTLIRTDVELLGTTRIAGRALRSLHSSADPEDFLRDYRGTGVTNNLLRIDVTGEDEAQAVARAEALADAFVADHVRRMRETAEAEAKALLDQRDRMRDELARVNTSIGGRSPESGPKASARIESLFARRAELNSRIADFDQRAAEARTGAPRIVAGTQIVDAPRAVHHSLPAAAATDAAIGLALGLALGLAVAAVGAVVADRPVLRREIAANLGASVLAELPLRTGRLWQPKRKRAAHERLTATLARTVRGSAEPLSLLELGCARRTGVLALDLAGTLAADGPVAVLDGLPGPYLTNRRRQPDDPVVPVGGEVAADTEHPERRLGVGSVAPGTAWTDLRHLGTRTVLVVRAGHGSAAWLHTVARQLADQHIPVLGVVLIDPDPRDRTDGTLWDGTHTAARGRNERPAARRNGTAVPQPERLPVPAARVPDSDQEAR
ncbi:polysaccharide biosynthesis protein [Streptomyces qinglanensis]|uniref:Polysaccharide biosynthesis protein n=1 Tax=Streptomyces qinglanensis TaxID=943816 RepID=A0A1E7K5J2_9ACTN|nr:Wzz/FepE/Etk N-terminal domain-containing protein [Streptomyces qinglanensis]OEU99202.1 polysaccharide biosynthesis protein [Streptomyces qinglanensis]